jgi:hypothetical protein
VTGLQFLGHGQGDQQAAPAGGDRQQRRPVRIPQDADRRPGTDRDSERSVPVNLWDSLLDRATVYVDILVYVGMFMTEKPNLLMALKEKAENGARVRLLFGDRNAAEVTQRSLDEGIGEHTIAAKIEHALAFFGPLAGTSGIEIRTHGTVLYNSIYRFDDEMIVNPHVYGKVASHAPALHLRRLSAGDLFTTYEDSFTAVWETAAPWGD